MFAFGSTLGVLILAVDIAVIFEVFQSGREMLNKVLWAALVLFCPLIGIICYLLFAERKRHRYQVTL